MDREARHFAVTGVQEPPGCAAVAGAFNSSTEARIASVLMRTPEAA